MTPSQEKDVLPETHTYKGIVEIFGSLQKVDKQVTLFPIYEAEAGETATPPIVDVNLFPSDLETLQMNYVSLDNPWDLKKVLPGQTDSKTGLEKRQKAIYITVLLGSRYAFTHIFQICFSSLAARGYYVKHKDVDALQTKSILGMMGTPRSGI
jgi:hypothetical protein